VLNQLAALLVMDRTSLYRTIRGIEEAGWVTINAGRARRDWRRSRHRGRRCCAAVEPDGRRCRPKSTTVWAMTAGSD
jgi:DNA-binding MarR family transcriptional regulator